MKAFDGPQQPASSQNPKMKLKALAGCAEPFFCHTTGTYRAYTHDFVEPQLNDRA